MRAAISSSSAQKATCSTAATCLGQAGAHMQHNTMRPGASGLDSESRRAARDGSVTRRTFAPSRHGSLRLCASLSAVAAWTRHRRTINKPSRTIPPRGGRGRRKQNTACRRCCGSGRTRIDITLASVGRFALRPARVQSSLRSGLPSRVPTAALGSRPLTLRRCRKVRVARLPASQMFAVVVACACLRRTAAKNAASPRRRFFLVGEHFLKGDGKAHGTPMGQKTAQRRTVRITASIPHPAPGPFPAHDPGAH